MTHAFSTGQRPEFFNSKVADGTYLTIRQQLKQEKYSNLLEIDLKINRVIPVLETIALLHLVSSNNRIKVDIDFRKYLFNFTISLNIYTNKIQNLKSNLDILVYANLA